MVLKRLSVKIIIFDKKYDSNSKKHRKTWLTLFRQHWLARFLLFDASASGFVPLSNI
jgi:hypothetical protein